MEKIDDERRLVADRVIDTNKIRRKLGSVTQNISFYGLVKLQLTIVLLFNPMLR